MKKLFAVAISFGLIGALSGCGDEAKVESTKTIETPSGSSTITKTEKIESSGEAPPIDVKNSGSGAAGSSGTGTGTTGTGTGTTSPSNP